MCWYSSILYGGLAPSREDDYSKMLCSAIYCLGNILLKWTAPVEGPAISSKTLMLPMKDNPRFKALFFFWWAPSCNLQLHI